MTEEYRKLLGAAGYHELALGIRSGIFGGWEETELPLLDLSTEELKDRTEKFWLLLKKPQGEGIGLFEIQERLRLSEKELYLVFLTALWRIHDGFWPLFMRLGTKGPQIPLEWVGMMMEMTDWQKQAAGGQIEEAAEKRRNPVSVNQGRIKRLMFPGFGTEPSLGLDEVFAAHFALRDSAPFWWKAGTEWFRCEEKAEEIVGVKRRELAVHLAEYLKAGNELLFLDGMPGSGRRFLLKQAARILGKDLLFVRLTVEFLKERGIVGILVREALLGRGLPVIVCPFGEQETEGGQVRLFLKEMEWQCREEEIPFLVIGSGMCDESNSHTVAGRMDGGFHDERRHAFVVEMLALDRGERPRLWELMSNHMRLAGDVSLEELADRYELLPGQIRAVLSLAEKQAAFLQAAIVSRELLFSCCHRYLRQDLGGKAVQVPVRFSWEDLLLEKKQKDKLMRAENQIRFHGQVFEEWGLGEKFPYGRGVSLVFSGPPGTGKTMAAQVLAGRIGMELYRVELPAVVSKYIGETEKHLNEIFEHAKKAQVVLFFDEADVLFGKRTDVRDSNDKYSNMEAAFLLQKMESYNGVTILATNFLRNMDEAFKRRIRYLVEFPFPDRRWRALIWKQAFPARLPLRPDIDLEFLAAAFELSGAGIRNVVLEAAFLSAAENEDLGMSQLVRAAKGELEKNGKTMALEEFGPYAMYLDTEEHDA